MNWQTVLSAMLPEHLLLAGIVALLVLELAGNNARAAFAIALATAVAAAAAALWLHATRYSGVPFAGHYGVTPAVSLAKFIVLALAVPGIVMAHGDFDDGRPYVLVLGSLYGACLMPASVSFLTLFLGLELLSLPVYALVLLGLRRPEGAEAALKYLVLGGTATAAFLFGTSLLYGATGTLAIDNFGAGFWTGDATSLGGATLIVTALYLKAAIVPLHAWAPDAYEAAGVPVTAFMATVVKAAVLIAALRILGSAPLGSLTTLLPLASMVWGNLAAIRQTSFRRMIAYSSIAHAGYLYFAFLGAPGSRYQAVLFYLVTYGVMTLLAFAALPAGDDAGNGDRLDSLKGLFQRRPGAALAIAASMLSLAGLPPLPGFVAKFLVFRNVLAGGFTTWAVLGLVASYLGLYFYLRVVQYMFMQEAPSGAATGGRRPLAWLAGTLCLVPAVLIALFPGWLLDRL